MSENKGYTYVSVLVVFLLLAGTTWNLFFIIKNFKEQNIILEKNIEITNRCISLSKEYLYREENYTSFYTDSIQYIIWHEKNGSLKKVSVWAYKDGTLKEKVINFKYIQLEDDNEETQQ